MFHHRRDVFLFFLIVLNGLAIRKSNAFDVLIFTQHWPQSVCFIWKEESTSHTCSLPNDNHEWTIHGLWPSVYNKLGPQFCNSSLPFDKNALKSLEYQLKEKWIDIEYGKESYSLWQHEWDKHGTCATVLPKLNTELKYFKESLALLSQYDMKHVLGKANIMPGKEYAVTDIFNAVERVLGKRGAIMCRKDKNTGKSYLYEIEICFDKTFQLINCNDVHGYPTNCDRSASVIYPSNVSRDYHVVQV